MFGRCRSPMSRPGPQARSDKEPPMHKIAIPQSIIDRVIARRGREHIHDDLDPVRTALVVVDMQNAFMLPGVAHSLCLMAQEIVPNINRLAQADRETGGAVGWIQSGYSDERRKHWTVSCVN